MTSRDPAHAEWIVANGDLVSTLYDSADTSPDGTAITTVLAKVNPIRTYEITVRRIANGYNEEEV